MVLDLSHNALKGFAEKLPPAAKPIVALFDETQMHAGGSYLSDRRLQGSICVAPARQRLSDVIYVSLYLTTDHMAVRRWQVKSGRRTLAGEIKLQSPLRREKFCLGLGRKIDASESDRDGPIKPKDA